MAAILIKNGRIWDGERFFYGDVLTDGAEVAQIAQHIHAPAAYEFDATGCIVSAGLIDAHVHILGTEPDPYGINAEMSAIPFGVTAVADAGGARANRELADSWLVKNVTFAQVDIADDKADFTCTEQKLERYGDRIIGIKVYFDTTDCDVRSIKPLKEACDYARARGLLVMVHCSHSPTPMAQIVDTLSPGDILTHAYHGAEHSAAEDDFACLRRAKERGVILDTGFSGHCHVDLGLFCQAVERGGAPDTISTDITRDSAYKRGGRYGMTMCMSMARTAGMDEEAIFRAVTTTPAKALGKAGQWGCLKEKGCADIAVVRYTNEPFRLENRGGTVLSDTQGYRCALTLCNGYIVYRD